ncbi:MAG: transporter substrate-binding domain-containing protein [Syntrophobacteraceae bacterium]|nr:transporter substrate-binding domain-containing protein [Desulfobacteraceae bacterium]
MNLRFSMLRTSIVLVIAIGIAVAAGNRAAAGGLDDARQRGKLLVGVRSDFPPFGYVDESGIQQGLDVEMAGYLAQKLFDADGRLELVSVTSGSRIPFLYSRWIDVIAAAMTITEQRKQVLEFSEPYFLSESLLLVAGDIAVSGLKDLEGKKVGVLKGAIQEKDLEQIAPRSIRTGFATLGEAVEALKAKSVDVVCTDDMTALFLARKNPGLKAAGPPFNPHPYALAVRKGDTEFLNWINRQLARMKEDGTYEKLRQKYLAEMESSLKTLRGNP